MFTWDLFAESTRDSKMEHQLPQSTHAPWRIRDMAELGQKLLRVHQASSPLSLKPRPLSCTNCRDTVATIWAP